MPTFNGKDWERDDFVPFKYFENWDPFWGDVIAEMDARAVDMTAAVTAAAASTMPVPIGVVGDGAAPNGFAVPLSKAFTWIGVSAGWPLATAALCIIAAIAATCGDAMDVPTMPSMTSPSGLGTGVVVPMLPVDQM